MTVTAELNFVSNIASEAAAAATSIDRLHASLVALASVGSISLGADMSSDLATAAASAANIGEIATANATKIEEIAARSSARIAEIAASGEARQADIAAKQAASLATLEASAAAKLAAIEASGVAAVAAQEAKASAAIATTEAKGTADLARINAQAQAQFQAHAQRVVEMQQAGVNEIMVGASKAMHAESAIRLQQEHKIAELKIKGEQEANKIALKGDQDRQKLLLKSQLDAQKQAQRSSARAAGGGPSRIGGAAQSLLQGGGLQGAATSLGGAAGTFASAALVLSGAVGGAVIGGAKMAIDAAEFKNNMLQGLGKMLGGAGAAQAAYKQIQTIANVTPFETQDVAIFYRTLAGGLGDVKKTEDALKAVADVAALNDFDTEKAKRLSDTIAKMGGSGKLSIETLNQLGDASGGVIGRGDIFDAIAATTGQARADIQKQIEQGKIDSSKGLDAILSVVRKKVSGGELGSLAKTLGESSVTGLLSTIRGVGTSLLEDVNIQPVIKGLKSISDAIQGPAGERLKGSLERFFSNLFEAIFGPLGDAQGPDRVVKIIDNVSATIDKAAVVIKDATPTVQAFSAALLAFGGGDSKALDGKAQSIYGAFSLIKEAIKSVLPGALGGTFGPGGLIQPILDILGIDADASEVRKWVDAVAGLMNPINIFRSLKASATGEDATLGNPILKYIESAVSGAATGAFDSASAIGTNIVDGIVAGISGGLSRVASSAVQMGDTAIAAVKGALDSHSPSRAMMDIGGDAPAGMAIGIRAGIPDVVAASTAMSEAGLVAAMGDPFPYRAAPANVNGAPGVAPQFAAGQASASGGVVVQITIGSIVANTAEDADALARALEPRIRDIAQNEFVAALRKVSGQ